jgi:hypothetical protein
MKESETLKHIANQLISFSKDQLNDKEQCIADLLVHAGYLFWNEFGQLETLDN